MPPVKRITDLTRYASVLPYASELFGIYQPLLGWRSARIQARYAQGLQRDKQRVLQALTSAFGPVVDLRLRDGAQLDVTVAPGVLTGGRPRRPDSVVLERIGSALPPYAQYTPAVWPQAITADRIDVILKKDVPAFYAAAYAELRKADSPAFDAAGRSRSAGSAGVGTAALERQLQYESSLAGALLYLVRNKDHAALEALFYSVRDSAEQAEALQHALSAGDSAEAYLDLEHLDPTDREQLKNVALSPISVVHLFRQYFFELDSFLGTPEGHVWLSPGSSVELIEVHTRRVSIEKTLETLLETTARSEKTVTEQDELSEAVKEDNGQDIKFGASVTASYGSIEASSSFDYATSQKRARETTHKRMRQQTEKLSSEIRKSYKSTFKTVTELTDLSSTKHLLANTTSKLVNYELRRKMRQVGVQVQDIGTFLCWQTYVDDPGQALGLAKLIHIAPPPALDAIPHPEEIPMLQPFQESKMVTLPFISVDGTDADNEGEVYVDGVEADDSEWWGLGTEEHIQSDFTQTFVAPKSDYELTNVEFDAQGRPVSLTRTGPIENANDRASFVLHLHSADFQGQNSVEVKLILQWSPKPGANDAIAAQNKANVAAFQAKEKAAYEKAYVEAVKERVTLASKISPRPSQDLREEERIVVYRKLIQELLLNKVDLPDDRTRHVVAELLDSIFDVDKMLYFVAPEWWRPRLHRSRQQLQEAPQEVRDPLFDTGAVGAFPQRALMRRLRHGALNAGASSLLSASTVGWGGVEDATRDNYFITDESEPARLGSSLGWLLQLDGDNRRNAFLNAPWVKAVIPIRPGKEEAAINWLRGVEGMEGITDDVLYHASSEGEVDVHGQPLEGQKLIDVLRDLAKKIARKHAEAMKTDTYPKPQEVSDPALVDDENTVTATPVDRVYEHGFFPLEGGFRANVGKDYEIFDQWLEILPTDQTVPVEVRYDPRTGRMIEE
ncbi:hypothetical protein FGE12_25605 [Aggregicoccus sp. 17bor-14]|uniref:hypothetical protein n=1 Tax=Myxococcaceae TaxID=31 RepID=UPI00129C8D83|nr:MULTISPECIES: hypothetical protein [Myxococcaceae]MBF5045810.1 hypothetical protein [Simulacricoccus sp. 17bor-14]MRI91545.1 hypothetical protein [Aggregicoccus sp. 17bor-14]